jgi:sulfite exporter TauE/SafE
MIDLPLVLLGGLLGSAHCLGMCGPLALTLGAGSASAAVNLRRQLVYSAGRIFTYSFCGAAGGFAGGWLGRQSRALTLSQAWIAIVAGAALVLIGLVAAGVLPRRASRWLGSVPCSAARGLKTFLTAPGWANVLLAGVFTGFIPCGLVYAFLLKAVSTASLWQGAATMAAFGLGTVPLMAAAGCGASLFDRLPRERLYRLAAWSVVLAGAMTLGRGVWQCRAVADGGSTPACPLCAQEGRAPAE